VVLSVDGHPVSDTKELQAIVTNTPAGATVQMKVYRGGEILDIPVELEEQPESFGPQTILARRGPQIPEGESFEELGISVAETPLGLLITDVREDSRAAVKNLRPGDRIVKSEQKTVTTLEEFKKSIDGVDVAKDGVILKVAKRDGNEPLVVLGRDEK
jgi:S1-C subfamily serine protease